MAAADAAATSAGWLWVGLLCCCGCFCGRYRQQLSRRVCGTDDCCAGGPNLAACGPLPPVHERGGWSQRMQRVQYGVYDIVSRARNATDEWRAGSIGLSDVPSRMRSTPHEPARVRRPVDDDDDADTLL